MPLYHIHGLSVNVLATALSGASVVCTPGYRGGPDALGWYSESLANWYSAVPTMHLGLVEAGDLEAKTGNSIKPIEVIRNCSAALVPVLAQRMEVMFDAVVLPTYAMSESMPIASNPLPPHHRVLRSVGFNAGPQMELRIDGQKSAIVEGAEAEICVTGACVTKGYEFRPHMDEDPNLEGFTGDGWLRTGDKGYFDQQGYLCLSGRYKEIINRGGEKISPFEIENACRHCAFVRDCIAFSVPHVQLGETVGLAVVLQKEEKPKLGEDMLAALRRDAIGLGGLADKWAPDTLLIMEDIPKGSTGKPARIGLSKRVNFPTLDASASDQVVIFEMCNGFAKAVDGSEREEPNTTTKPGDRVAARDSLGIVRELGKDEADEGAVINTMYGLCILFIHLQHQVMFKVRKDTTWLDHYICTNCAPTLCFFVVYGYAEARQRHFLFGSGRQEFAILAIIVFSPILRQLFHAFAFLSIGSCHWQPIWPRSEEFPGSDNTLQEMWKSCLALIPEYLPGHIPQASIGFVTLVHWFLPYLLRARVVLVILHKLKVPGWMQLCASFLSVTAFVIWFIPGRGSLADRTSFAQEILNYSFLVIGAYYGEALVRAVKDLHDSMGHTVQKNARAMSLMLLVALALLCNVARAWQITTYLEGGSCFNFQKSLYETCDKSDHPILDYPIEAPAMANLAHADLWAPLRQLLILCVLGCFVGLAIAWVIVLGMLAVPRIWPFDYIGQYVLFPYLLSQGLSSEWSRHGIKFREYLILPSIDALAPAFQGAEEWLCIVDLAYIILAQLFAVVFGVFIVQSITTVAGKLQSIAAGAKLRP
jgi:hypothetical protein